MDPEMVMLALALILITSVIASVVTQKGTPRCIDEGAMECATMEDGTLLCRSIKEEILNEESTGNPDDPTGD